MVSLDVSLVNGLHSRSPTHLNQVVGPGPGSCSSEWTQCLTRPRVWSWLWSRAQGGQARKGVQALQCLLGGRQQVSEGRVVGRTSPALHHSLTLFLGLGEYDSMLCSARQPSGTEVVARTKYQPYWRGGQQFGRSVALIML